MRTTMRGTPVVAAPGKLFLVGEYAVLEGGTAVLAAIDRLASGQFMAGLEPESPFVAESVRAAALAIGDMAVALPYGSVLVDTSTFTEGASKLGLGSSAATAVASVGAVMELAGMSIADNRDLLFSIADGAHRTAQGGMGSGADVAASVYGGVVRFRRPPGGAPAIETLPPPASLEMVAFWTGEPADTASRVEAVQAFGRRARPVYESIVGNLVALGDQFANALIDDNVGEAIAAVRAYGQGLVDLGAAAEVRIVTAPFLRAAELAAATGGAAKPSGAGGGDVGIALFPERDAAGAFTARAREAGLLVLDLGIELAGAHRRQPGGPR